MLNTTKINIPKKYQPLLAIVEKDIDGYWAYSKNGYYFPSMGCHTAHEDSQIELMKVIRTITKCDCDACKKNEVYWGES